MRRHETSPDGASFTARGGAILSFTAAFAASLALALGALSTPATAADPEELRIGYFQSPNGELLAKGQGLLAKRFPNTKIRYIKFDVGRDVNAAFAGGSLDIGIIGTPPGTAGLVNSLPYKIYYLHDIIGESEALVVKESSGIADIQGVKGKTIATPFGSTSHFSLLAALKQNGIDPKELKILDITGQEVHAAWTRGDIDGAYIWQPAQATLLAEGGRIITNSREVAGKGGITGEFGIVSDKFYAEHPDVVKAYIEILERATADYKAASPENVAILARELGLTADETRSVISQIIVLDASDQKDPKYLGTSSRPGALAQLLKDTADFLLADKAIKVSPPAEFFKPFILTELYE
ncbi:MAG: ABC transporter substrate-binding protein [Deltaproteobacteria bacterium]|jgi:taurine transport system substrate-binding protein|nr:ABC transporter substrate-binding protein [Deltaproteobacteria bacterium]